jgi:hypothetical protein
VKWYGPSHDELWKQIASSLRGEYVPGPLGLPGKIEVQHGPWVVSLDSWHKPETPPTVITRIRAPFINRDGFRFMLSNEDILIGAGPDIEIGDPEFDREYTVQSNSAVVVRRLLDSHTIRKELLRLHNARLEIRHDGGWFSKHHPKGVDELYFVRPGPTGFSDLKMLFDLFGRVLDRLTMIGSAYEGDPYDLHDELTLLRGTGPGSSPGELLRPAAVGEPNDPKKLLRPK